MEVELIGHRGFREWQSGLPPEQQAPENSIAAFEQSYSPKKLDGVELDVHLSRDNKLVVFHDDDLNELTDVADLLRQPVPATGSDPLANVNGVDLTRLRGLQTNDPAGQGKIYIADLDLAEIQALRLKTHPDNGVRHTTTHAIPTLTRVFEAVDARRASNPEDNGKFKINIEVKEAKMYQRQPGGAVVTDPSGSHQTIGKDIAGAVTRTVDDFLNAGPAAQWSKADNLVVSSFHQMTLGRLRHADPEVPRRALYSTFEERDFRISPDGASLEMSNRGAEDWSIQRPALPTDHLFNQRERVWDMTEAELTQAFADDARLPIVDLNGAALMRGDQPLVGVEPQSIAISISEMTPAVARTIRDSGAEICVWTANEQSTAVRPREETAALLDFLEDQQVTAFITDNSDSIVRERAAWREQKRQAAEPSRQTAATQTPGPAPAQPTGLVPPVEQQSTRRARTPSPPPRPPQHREPEIQVTPLTQTPSRPPPALPSQPRSTGTVVQPQRRSRGAIPLILDDLPADARPLRNNGSTPGSVLFNAAFANGLAQTVAMCVAYGVALSYISVLASRAIPNDDGSIAKKLGRATGQALLEAPILALGEESVFGLAAEAAAAALGGAVVPRSDPYPEFRMPPSPGPAPAAQDPGLPAWQQTVHEHNRALEYVRTHGGSAPDEAQGHPFSALVLHPDDPADAVNFQARLRNYNDPAQAELRRRAEGIFRNRPLELSDYPEANAHAPSHIRDGLQWRQRRHDAEVAYANDVLSQAGVPPIPAHGSPSYDQEVREVRRLLDDRSRQLTIGRLAFAHDQRSADYGSFPIDVVLIGAFAFCAGASAASLPKSVLQSVWGTTFAGTLFGAINNYTRLQNRHFPERLPLAPGQTEPTAVGPRDYPNGIPTHYVLQGNGLKQGLNVLGEIWKSISDSERLSEGVLGARNPLEKVRNHGQQFLSYVIGCSYGLTAYNLVRTGIDHAVKGSQGPWQSFLRETAATAAFVTCGDLSILHHSVYGRRGVSGVSPAYAATREAFGDLWSAATGKEVFSTVDRSKLSKAVNRAYDTVEKLFRVTQHAVMDTVNVPVTAVTNLVSSSTAGRAAETEQYYGRNAPPATAYGTLSYQDAAIDGAARASAIQTLSGDRPLSDDEAVKRLRDLRNQADKLWDAQDRLEKLWGDIFTEQAVAQQAAPLVTAGQQPGAVLPADWRPSPEQAHECAEVLRDLKAAREAIDILRRAEINVARARDEQATEVELTAIADRLAHSVTPADVDRNQNALQGLLERPTSGIDHQTFETMVDTVIAQNANTAQHRQAMLDRGYQGINERTVTMVADVMADLVKNDKQQTNDVAAVMETLVDDARRTGMSDNRFAQIVQDQFHRVGQGANAEQVDRLNNAAPAIANRVRTRYTDLAAAGNALDTRRTDLAQKEKALERRVRR